MGSDSAPGGVMPLPRFTGLVAVWLVLAAPAMAQFRGRVVMSGEERSDVVVTLQTLNGQIVYQTFTGTRGDFRLEGVGVSTANPMYLVIEEEGYRPYRQLIVESDIRGSGMFIIYLEPDNSEGGTAARGRAPTVDLRQLRVEIPAAALEDYDAALEESADGDYERAAADLERAVDRAPDFYDAWIDLGGAYTRLSRPEDAKAAYLSASEVNPAGTLARLNLGAIYYQQGEREIASGTAEASRTFSIAEEWLRKAVGLDPASAEARFFLGACLYQLEQYAEAEDMLQRAIAFDDDHADARLMLINVYVKQGRYPAALEAADSFLENFPERGERAAIERVRDQLASALGR